MKFFLTIFTLFAVVGCSTKNDQLKIESNHAVNYKQIDAQAEVASKALEYLASKKQESNQLPVIKTPTPKKKPEQKKEYPADPCKEACKYCSNHCFEQCNDFYEIKYPDDVDCLNNQPPDGWHFDGKTWVCDDLLIPGFCAGAGPGNYGPATPGNSVTISPVGNNNVIVQSSPGAQVHYGGSAESEDNIESALLKSIADFINRKPVKLDKLATDKVIEAVPGVLGVAADAAVKITGLSVFGSFAEKSVEQAGNRYETGGDYGSSGHDQSTGSHIKITEIPAEPEE